MYVYDTRDTRMTEIETWTGGTRLGLDLLPNAFASFVYDLSASFHGS